MWDKCGSAEVASKAYYNADIAIIFTNSHLTEAASELAKLNNVIVFDRNTLRNTLKQKKI
ncbi:restriction endonuclease [Caldicoprobacter sp.]|uniref:restriction endonuclease n=1 Tax=Caldicoprobacter sp. TaxID=2004500 RepID=UPI0039C1E447